MRPSRLLVMVAVGCATRGRPARSPQVLAPAPSATRAPWRSLVAQSLPAPLRALSARDAESAAVVADDRAYLLRGDSVTPLCEDLTEAGDVILRAVALRSGTLVLGTRAGALVMWRGSDDGRCVPLPAPSLSGANAPDAAGAGAQEDRVWLWSAAGEVWGSDDAGGSWRALPPLPRVSRVFAGPGGETWAAASAGQASNPRDGAAHRGRIARLHASAPPQWRPLAEDRLLPVATSQRRDGVWLVADGLDLSVAHAQRGLARERWLPWSRTRQDAPSEIIDAGDGRFVAAAGRMLFRVDAGGLQPAGLLPGGAAPLRISATPDGAIWAMDASTLWQARDDLRWRDRTRRPWSSAAVLAARVRGETVAVATDDGRLAVRDGATGRWSSQELPAEVGRVLSLEVNDRGTIFALCERGAVMGDGRGLTAVDAPTQRGGMDETPGVHAIGDRWVVLRGGAWTSDDEGATWVRRLGTQVGTEEMRPLSQLVVVGGRALAMDEDFNLWRSDDGAASWRRLSTQTPWPGAAPARWNSSRPLLAWDGRARVAVLARNVLALSDDLGAEWTTRPVNALASALALRDRDAVFVAVGRPGSGNSVCDGAPGVAVLGGDSRGLGLAEEACERLGDIVHLDGERGVAVSVRRDGSAWVGQLDAMLALDTPRIY